jgi:hypothetical protein
MQLWELQPIFRVFTQLWLFQESRTVWTRKEQFYYRRMFKGIVFLSAGQFAS